MPARSKDGGTNGGEAPTRPGAADTVARRYRDGHSGERVETTRRRTYDESQPTGVAANRRVAAIWVVVRA